MATKYNPLAGKKFVVIGGTSGIGLGVAELALSLNAIVFVGSSSPTKVASAVQKLETAFPQGQAFGKAVDVTSETSLKEFVEWVKSTGEDGIDHVVWTAGSSLVISPLEQLDLAELTALYQTRLFGILILVKLLKPVLKAGSSLTLTLGVAAYKPAPGWAPVSSVAGAVASLARGLAVDLAPNVRVNAVAPGAVDTPLWDVLPGVTPAARAKIIEDYASKLLTKQIGTPDEVAHAYIYLASSGFATGQVVVIDGGQLLV